MRQFQLLLFVSGAAACASEAPPTSAVVSAITAAQGVSYQGVSYQGVSYQGVSYQGVSYQGASYQGVALSDASVAGSALVVWKQRPDGSWEQRFPDRICPWNAARTAMAPCTSVNLATTPSPLAGATWQAVFAYSDGTTAPVTIQIGTSATQVGAVQPDTAPGSAPAMFALDGSTASGTTVAGTPGASCGLVPQGQRIGGGPVCRAPGGCRTNCDVWLYDVRVPGVVDGSGQPVGLCPAGELAIALAGAWDATGELTPSSTLFTFACTNGTIAKCTRWGYRPWDSALMSSGAPAALAPYHQACIRAAIADYCADGTSWTRNGTLVDVYDYPTTGQSVGFIERTRGGIAPYDAATAFVWESSFDGSGATRIDHTRYMGIQAPSTPSLECSSRFVLDPVNSDGAGGSADWVRVGTLGQPIVSIDSTPVCAHAELAVGTWLHRGCSACTELVRGYGSYVDPVTHAAVLPYAYCTQAGNRWDSACAQIAQSQCPGSQRMASHGECVAGAGIGAFATGCALKLELDIAYESCAGSWTSTCVAAANARCTGGQETFNRVGQPVNGFCGSLVTGF